MELSNLIYKEDLNNGATGPTGPTGPQGNIGPIGLTGATGPTERLFKSSNKKIIDSNSIIPCKAKNNLKGYFY